MSADLNLGHLNHEECRDLRGPGFRFRDVMAYQVHPENRSYQHRPYPQPASTSSAYLPWHPFQHAYHQADLESQLRVSNNFGLWSTYYSGSSYYTHTQPSYPAVPHRQDLACVSPSRRMFKSPIQTNLPWNRSRQEVSPGENQRSNIVKPIPMEVDEHMRNKAAHSPAPVVRPKDEDADFMDGSRSNSPHNDENDGASKHSNKVDPKVCGVCGDKALGNNFNAITCESCKAFFRRNALKAKTFLCPFSDNCKVDPVTRRFCQKCRLKKCVEIGMKKEWIMTEEEKKMKKQKIEQNRLKRQSSDVPFSLEPPLNKVACLIDQNSPVSRSATPSPLHQTHSPPDLTLPNKGGKLAMMPYNIAGRPDYGEEPGYQAGSVPNGNNAIFPSFAPSPSPSSSSCSNGSDISLAYQTPPPLLSSLNVSQIEQAQQYLSKSSRNGDTPSPVLIHHHSHPDQGLSQHQHVWQAESGSNHPLHSGGGPQHSQSGLVAPYTSQHKNGGSHSHHTSASSSPVQCDKSTFYPGPASNQIVKSSQSHNMGSSSMARVSVSSEFSPTQMPLLSSLIRPGVGESPPDAGLLDCSTSSIGGRTYSAPSSARDLKPVVYHEVQHSPVSSVTNEENPREQYTPQPHVHDQPRPLRLLSKPEVEEDIPPPLPLNTMDSIMSVAITAEFNSFGMLGNSQESMSNNLNRIERAKLRELLMASQALMAPVDEEGPIKVSETADPSLINVINLTDIAIRRIIKMSKKISGFKNMCQEDQIALLKGSCTEMMILRSAVSYDPDRDSWNIPHSFGYNIKLGVLKEARGNLYEEHQRFVKSFKPEWRSDENIMIILCAITLFTAERPNVIHQDVVKLEQDSYYYLLRRYLESILNGCEARSTYLQLIRKIAELHILNSNHLRVFLEVNPREVEPLLIEIFDLSKR